MYLNFRNSLGDMHFNILNICKKKTDFRPMWSNQRQNVSNVKSIQCYFSDTKKAFLKHIFHHFSHMRWDHSRHICWLIMKSILDFHNIM